MDLELTQLSITSHPENLKRIRNAMRNITSKAPGLQDDSDSIILAVDEACSNIIKHCCQNDLTRKITLTIKLKEDLLTILIIDNGQRFDIKSINPRDINEIRPGGLGVHIMRQIMDTVEYSHTPDGLNQLTMTKKLCPASKK
jgi:anti-sigma regulatory factor (Ser/Thr protein kinase)